MVGIVTAASCTAFSVVWAVDIGEGDGLGGEGSLILVAVWFILVSPWGPAVAKRFPILLISSSDLMRLCRLLEGAGDGEDGEELGRLVGVRGETASEFEIGVRGCATKQEVERET